MRGKRKPRTVQFRVAIALPPGATIASMREYIHDAVSTWCGSLKPPGADDCDPEGDPLFSISRETIKVTWIKQPALVART